MDFWLRNLWLWLLKYGIKRRYLISLSVDLLNISSNKLLLEIKELTTGLFH
jgi:hypothetical protein